MAETAQFVSVPKCSRARLSAANTARDGSGTVVTLATGGASGSRFERVIFISAQATAAATSNMVARVFVSDTSGANYRLRGEIELPTITASATAKGQTQTISFTGGIPLEPNQLLGVTISVYAGVQDQYDAIAEGGNF